jgi:probable F420-dependent oxidoreductase
MTRFGTSLPAVQQIPGRSRPWERDVGGCEIVATARAAEAAGFGWVSCSDHVLVPASRAGVMGATWYDAGSTLAFVAGATTRIGLLSHVLVLPYRHPLVVAKQYGTLDHLSGGRVILGVGSGHLKPEFAVLGVAFDARGRTTDESIDAIAAAWEQEVAACDGEVVRFRDVMVSPRPARRPRPPIWVGGNSRAAVRRAARRAEGWIPWSITCEDFAGAAAHALALRSETGRTGEFTLVAPLDVPRDATAGPVLDAATRWTRAGATAFHVGFAADSLPHLLERLDWFGRAVGPHLEDA